MNVRLIAYRKATSSSTLESTYELDLMDNPNVPLNFRFSDIKNPETRKASYSQTFKLPFTPANNEFFQTWFNVNLDAMVFSTTVRFSATLMVGSVPQFEGVLQLKGVYQKAQVYEVVLMSNTADLFSSIGEKKLKDVFLESNGTYSRELNHIYDATTIQASWDGGTSGMLNVLGTALRDVSAGVQKVMYPFSSTVPSFYWAYNYNQWLGMSDVSDSDAFEKIVPITQLRPAIQLRTMFKLIMAQAGFSYSSDFIDCTGDYASDNYFGKLFMTTGNKLEAPELPSGTTGVNVPSGTMSAYTMTTDGFGLYITTGSSCQEVGSTVFQAQTEQTDSQNVWNSSQFYFTRISSAMTQATIYMRIKRRNIRSCDHATNIYIDVGVQKWNPSTSSYEGSIIPRGQILSNNTAITASNTYAYQLTSFDIDLIDLELGGSYRIILQPEALRERNTDVGYPQPVLYLAGGTWTTAGVTGNPIGLQFKSAIVIQWAGYTSDQYGSEIQVPACIDDSLTQRGFLKDIIERFNLIILTNPADPSNLIIEPYTDYMKNGATKHWTEKLDVSKEVVVRDTLSLQKRIINFSDKDDVDLMNKAIKEVRPNSSVYGKYYNAKTQNDFATGEMKNTPMFAPYINQDVKVWAGNEYSQIQGLVTQYEYTYKTQTDGTTETVLEPTQPKLFYYNGTASPIYQWAGSEGDPAYAVTIYMHQTNLGSGVITPHAFTHYPVCSPYDVNPDANGESSITADTKSLLWNFAVPYCNLSSALTWYPNDMGFEQNTLYFLYWKDYLNDIYNPQARIMECHLNLNEVDIFNFQFNDQIFIKDTYWRILQISNYQVGAKTSTKVTMIKVLDSLSNTLGCGYTPVGTTFTTVKWCPDDDPTCTPDTTDFTSEGYFATPECCEAMGGQVNWVATSWASQGLYRCWVYTQSLPAPYKTGAEPLSIISSPNTKGILSGKLGGINTPFVRGSNAGKYGQPIISTYGDDIAIKYKTSVSSEAQVEGESHRLVLIGNTEGTTRGYAYPKNNASLEYIYPPDNSTTMIQVSGISTVIGGTSSTHTLGDTESFNYHTAFVSKGGTVTQIGTAGGVVNWQMHQTSTTSTLNIAIGSKGQIEFGLDDSQSDTQKIWTLTVDITVQRLGYLANAIDSVGALWQDYTNIQLENNQNLLWN